VLGSGLESKDGFADAADDFDRFRDRLVVAPDAQLKELTRSV
jgi:hypothetical protein